MDIFSEISKKDHEQVVFCSDKETGLRAIIAIHNTTLGPSLGGCRMWPYKSDAEALKDVLRLSRGMTYKSAAIGLNLGGGKAVIIGDPKTQKSEALFRSFGRFVHSLGGRYITAEDVGTCIQDMEWIRMETDYVTGIRPSFGGSGDPSPVTAFGVFVGIKAALNYVTGSDSLEGRTVAIQGLGNVGIHLLESLVKAGSKVTATDIDAERIKSIAARLPNVEFVAPEAIYDVPCDVFAPCALGGVVNENTIERLRCKIIAGSANNILADEDTNILQLKKRDIVYVPDFVINAGGIVNVANELEGYRRKQAIAQASRIYDAVTDILKISKQEGITTQEAAMALAERRIRAIGCLKNNYSPIPLQKRGRGLR